MEKIFLKLLMVAWGEKAKSSMIIGKIFISNKVKRLVGKQLPDSLCTEERTFILNMVQEIVAKILSDMERIKTLNSKKVEGCIEQITKIIVSLSLILCESTISLEYIETILWRIYCYLIHYLRLYNYAGSLLDFSFFRNALLEEFNQSLMALKINGSIGSYDIRSVKLINYNDYKKIISFKTLKILLISKKSIYSFLKIFCLKQQCLLRKYGLVIDYSKLGILLKIIITYPLIMVSKLFLQNGLSFGNSFFISKKLKLKTFLSYFSIIFITKNIAKRLHIPEEFIPEIVLLYDECLYRGIYNGAYNTIRLNCFWLEHSKNTHYFLVNILAHELVHAVNDYKRVVYLSKYTLEDDFDVSNFGKDLIDNYNSNNFFEKIRTYFLNHPECLENFDIKKNNELELLIPFKEEYSSKASFTRSKLVKSISNICSVDFADIAFINFNSIYQSKEIEFDEKTISKLLSYFGKRKFNKIKEKLESNKEKLLSVLYNYDYEKLMEEYSCYFDSFEETYTRDLQDKIVEDYFNWLKPFNKLFLIMTKPEFHFFN